MTVSERDVDRVVVDTWTALLEMSPVPLPGWTDAPAANGSLVHAAVGVEGPWCGQVRLSAPVPLAVRCAAAMLDVPTGLVDLATTLDAFGELANVVGGNIKALLPPVCRLSLPSARIGPDPAGRPNAGSGALTLTFDCAGTLLVVTVEPRTNPSGEPAAPA